MKFVFFLHPALIAISIVCILPFTIRAEPLKTSSSPTQPLTTSKPAIAENFFDLSANSIAGEKIHFSKYRGKVVLVVNTASQCGFTPQLKDLEDLFKKYKDRGFIVLGFPSNDFKQEKEDNAKVKAFAEKEYGVSFPFFDKASVRGPQKQPVYQFLTEKKSGLLFTEVSWNFEKFLVDRKGQVIERWGSMTSPTQKSVTEKIEKALQEPL